MIERLRRGSLAVHGGGQNHVPHPMRTGALACAADDLQDSGMAGLARAADSSQTMALTDRSRLGAETWCPLCSKVTIKL